MNTKTQNLIPVLVLVFCVLGCSKLTGSGGKEVVYAPTEVGTPVGDNVTKDIGPSGGTIASPDGRLTLTVPQNAVDKSVSFAIQPITNKAANGLGLAYRLGPDGMTFATPVDVSVRYDEKDLEGTVPEALSVAYQDKKGEWHAQRSAKLDQPAKTISFVTTHFTDFAFLSRMRIDPPAATVRVGRSVAITLLVCSEPDLLDRLMSRPGNCSFPPQSDSSSWSVVGEGTISDGGPSGIMYNAPATRPDPNFAWVKREITFNLWDPQTGATSRVTKTFASRITIIDAGYKATGNSAGLAWSGTVCDLQRPFNLLGQARLLTFILRLTPSADGASGTATVSGGGHGVTLHDGVGSYTVTGADTDSPRIILTMESFKGSYPGVGTAEGSGTRVISLVPLDASSNECGGN